MMQPALSLLRNRLNEYFRIKTGGTDDYVNFLESIDPVSFPSNTITPYLINISEERVCRPADRYQRITREGKSVHINPMINLQLKVLFVAKFSDYQQSLNFLSYVIQYFQMNRYFDHLNAPELSDTGIERLLIELITLPLAEQNEIWNALHVTYLPSVLYEVSLLSYVDEASFWQPGGDGLQEIDRDLQQ